MNTILHQPAGRGHAYRPSLAQRVPVHPVADEPVRLGAVTAPGVTALYLDLEVDGTDRMLVADRGPVVAEEGDAGGEAGHLAGAAAAGEDLGDAVAWHVDLGAFPAGTHLAYRWRADDSTTTGWHRCTVAGWQPAGGDLHLDIEGDADLADRLLPGSVEWLIADSTVLRARFSVAIEPSEHLVGLGERFHALDQRGWRIDTKVFEQYKGQHTRTYLPVPFLLVVGGPRSWGLHVATTRRCWWDLGVTHPDRIVVEVACDAQADRGKVDLQLFAGAEPAEVLSAFWGRAGRPVPAPTWVLRPWISGNEWNTQDRVVAEATRSLQEGIPVGALVIEAWSDEATFTCFRDAAYEPTPDGAPHRLADFDFPADGAWPDPAGMVRWLHEQGVRVLLWQIPLLPEGVDDAQLAHDRQALVERGFAVREADGSPYRNRGWWFPGALMPDLTNDACVAWWIDKRRYLVDELGIDGFKTDGGEHAWGDDLIYADGTRGDVTNDRYPNLYAGAYHRLLAEHRSDGTTFSRAGSTGAGTVPCHWAGDEDSTWDAYRAAIVAGLTAGVSGVLYWGWDHGGFSGEVPSAELYLRTAAQACLSPIMQYHAEYNHHRQPNRDRTPWNIAERSGDDRVIPIYRRLAVLRDRLVPELDQQLRRGLERGLPLMRALCLEWPDDAQIWDWPRQYLLGDDLLVAPVTDPDVDTWPVYLPGDRWIDPWSGDNHTGPTTINLPAPLDRVPVLIRAAAAERLLPYFQHLPAVPTP